MIGLALEGGGVRGSYQAGAYIAFLECKIKIDGVCGTSIGALNGAFIASGKGSELPRIWRNINIGELFGFSEEYTDMVKKKKKNINLVKMTFLTWASILKNKGIDLSGLKGLIDKELDVNELISSPIDYGLVTVRLKDLKPICLFKEEMSQENIKDYILASSYLPIFKREKLIDDNYYLDGGFYDVGPVNMLLKKGYDTVYLIKIHGLGIHRKIDTESKVIIIEPKRSLGGILDLDPKRIEENIKMGYYDAIKVLKKLDGDNFVFEVKKNKYYQHLNRKISSNEYQRIKNFFKAKDEKETIIKSLEYIMEKEQYNYYQIYKIRPLIKEIKRKNKNHFIYNYVRKLKFFL